MWSLVTGGLFGRAVMEIMKCSTNLDVNKSQTLHVWNIGLHWGRVVWGVNVGIYSIHGA